MKGQARFLVGHLADHRQRRPGGLAAAEAMPDGPVETLLVTTLMSVLLVNTYASLHAPEVVYFYGLRALRSGLAAEDLHGDWVARGLRQAGRAAEPASGPRAS